MVIVEDKERRIFRLPCVSRWNRTGIGETGKVDDKRSTEGEEVGRTEVRDSLITSTKSQKRETDF